MPSCTSHYPFHKSIVTSCCRIYIMRYDIILLSLHTRLEARKVNLLLVCKRSIASVSHSKMLNDERPSSSGYLAAVTMIWALRHAILCLPHRCSLHFASPTKALGCRMTRITFKKLSLFGHHMLHRHRNIQGIPTDEDD